MIEKHINRGKIMNLALNLASKRIINFHENVKKEKKTLSISNKNFIDILHLGTQPNFAFLSETLVTIVTRETLSAFFV